MVRDGYYYGLVLLAAAVLVGWLTSPVWAAVPVLLAAFFLWFFRDPERSIPGDAGAVVSPADGKVTDVSTVMSNGKPVQRISIFLNVFNVHVNRSPVAGVIRGVRYQTGKYLNAMNPMSAEQNEQNTVTVEGDGDTVTFKQIAGLLARRIVFTKKIGERVERGERVGLIKFGSRVDVMLETSAEIGVKVGDHVKGGSSILAFLKREENQPAGTAAGRAQEGGALMDEAAYLQRRKEDRASRRLRKGMYILPSLFTTANMYLGFYAMQQITQGSLADYWHFDHAAIAIGFAVLFDGLDGRIARMTNTTSEFGRELDSLADVITFGVAPAFLAWMWGFRSISPYISYPDMVVKLSHLGAIAGFAFLVAGASRLARFNITANPQPSNPGRPGRKYFVGMPIPAGAGVIAAVVHLTGGYPPEWWATAVVWLVVIVIASYLMVSTWRFYSLKEVNFGSRQPSRLIVIFAVLFGAIWFFSRQVLFFVALIYMFSGVFWRLQWVFRRKRNPPPPTYTEASQTS